MRKILIVEDEDILRETYEVILSTLPCQLDVAENGQVALDKCQNTEYDLILLDIMMPIMSGLEFLEHFYSETANHTRVIILSNLSSGNEVDAALKLGATRSVLKADVSPRQLLDIVRYELEAS